MKIPAIRSKIGGLTYYVTSLTFQQISDYVSSINDQLHSSETLRDLIQRSITNNYLSIKEYILNQPEMFFSALVLAVYDDYPQWQEIEVRYEDEEYHQIGLLNFPGEHMIFPVDGQHRVEGIKAALEENQELANNRISVIFIGHDNENKQKTRRLFTTLNRYAKPVSLRDIIALDEDDSIAIITRYLLEEFDLFEGNRIVDIKNKAIPRTNTNAITSIIALYQANVILGKHYYTTLFQKKPTKRNFNDNFLKFRPTNEVVEGFKSFITEFWTSFKENLVCIQEYLEEEENMASNFRNSVTGGNLLFRPVGILPFVSAIINIFEREEDSDFDSIIQQLNEINLNISSAPWRNIVWNPLENKMIMNQNSLTRLLIIYLYNGDILTESELSKIREGYAFKLNIEEDEVFEVLDDLS